MRDLETTAVNIANERSRMMKTQQNKPFGRASFTLIELLVKTTCF